MSGNSNAFSWADAKETFNPADNFHGQPQLEHHLHRDSEPLPGSNLMAYGHDQHKHTGAWRIRRDIGTSFIHLSLITTPTSFDTMLVLITDNRLFRCTRIHQGTPEFQGRRRRWWTQGPSRGRPNVTDKMIGKLQRAARKYMNQPELHEKGELRESGGKLAAAGEAHPFHNEAQL
ncbi:hypothetical protein BDM02DRAFT_3191357 [Thelephora ganbajun]|uniref:Uncharacterized protein n=1 Tax=Thelephora ganbajun TaxID=370292 RepID=A0ACB6Z302_THEGA|nr:hypothetical protein BDM02DRAFT_3191357 [Thelephora ganbajun]